MQTRRREKKSHLRYQRGCSLARLCTVIEHLCVYVCLWPQQRPTRSPFYSHKIGNTIAHFLVWGWLLPHLLWTAAKHILWNIPNVPKLARKCDTQVVTQVAVYSEEGLVAWQRAGGVWYTPYVRNLPLNSLTLQGVLVSELEKKVPFFTPLCVFVLKL